MSVRRDMRHHSKRNPCPICGGGDNDDRGRDKRCFGWTSEDGYAHCSREEHAGSIDAGNDGCYAHRMTGSCKCGTTHGAEVASIDDKYTTYDYRDGHGVVRFQVVRSFRDGRKTFWQRHQVGGAWINGRGDNPWLLYRLPEVAKADPTKTVFIVEGEKDVDTVLRLGAVATCNPCGAGKWNYVAEAARTTLAGRDVVIVADNDEPGKRHAEAVRDALTGVCRSIQVMRAPEPHKDVTDLVEAGGGLNDLVALDASEPAGPTRAQQLAPELPFDELWSAEPELSLVVPAMGICPGPAHLVAGSWYTGKTLFLMAIGLAVASGKDVFGLYRPRKGVWAHFDHEMGRRGLKRYVQRVSAGMGLGPEDLRGRVKAHVLPTLNLCTDGALDLYTELLTGVDICTLDPLRAAAPGQDENGSEYRQWIDMLNVVSNRTGCSILVLHHGGKPTEGATRRNTGRGTSAIDDAVQSKFVLTAEEKGAPIHISHEKTRELTQPLEDFWLEMVNEKDCVRLVHRGADEMADVCSQREAKKEAVIAKRAEETIASKLMLSGGQFIGSRSELIAAVGGRRSVVTAALSAMQQSGRLAEDGRGSSRVWRLS